MYKLVPQTASDWGFSSSDCFLCTLNSLELHVIVIYAYHNLYEYHIKLEEIGKELNHNLAT